MKRLLLAGVLSAIGFAACAGTTLAPTTGEPIADATGFVAELRLATTPTAPIQITFAWALDEGGSRVNGEGVVRVEAPGRIRLDLFSSRGDTYLSAALVDGQYRFPAGPPAIELPSPALLWAALGVFDPPSGLTIQSANSDGQSADVRFIAANGEVFAYVLGRDETQRWRLERLERAVTRGVIESVRVEPGPDGPKSTAYRDWSAYRDLTLEVTQVREVDSFPPDIWRPGAPQI